LAQSKLVASFENFGTEPDSVRQKRNAVLAARGILEMSVQAGIQARELLAHAKYQSSLKSGGERAEALGQSSSAQLTEAIEAVAYANTTLTAALAAQGVVEPDVTVSESAAALIAEDARNCVARQKKIGAQVLEWKAALDEYTRWRERPKPAA